jgi:hypothetical protein
MNTLMWDHPATSVALDILRLWGYEVLGPVVKRLACNETGNGALISVQEIVKYMVEKQGIGPRLSPLSMDEDALISAKAITPRRSPRLGASAVPPPAQHPITSITTTSSDTNTGLNPNSYNVITTTNTPAITSIESTHSSPGLTVSWNVERCFALGLGAGLGLGIASAAMTYWLKQRK